MKRTTAAPLRAFTLTELLVAVAVIAVLLAILLPVLSSAREQGRRAACLSNVHQLGAALLMYAQDSDGFFPTHAESGTGPTRDWDNDLLTYVNDAQVFHCPSCVVPSDFSSTVSQGYALNNEISGAKVGTKRSVSEVLVPFPAMTVAFCEISFTTGPGSGVTSVTKATDYPQDGADLKPGESFMGPPGGLRHQGGSNYGFADGHARWYRPSQVGGGGTLADGRAVSNTGTGPSFAL